MLKDTKCQKYLFKTVVSIDTDMQRGTIGACQVSFSTYMYYCIMVMLSRSTSGDVYAVQFYFSLKLFDNYMVLRVS